MDKTKIVLFESSDGMVTLPVEVDTEAVWLSQDQMAQLFETTKRNVSKHVNNAIREARLTVSELSTNR